MSSRLVVIVLIALVSLLWLTIDTGIGQPGPTQVATRIGVVNMERAFQQSKQKAALEQALEGELRARLSKLEKMKGDVEKAEQSLALLEQGSEAYFKQQEAVATSKAMFQLYDERYRAELQQSRIRSFDKVYAEIRAVTATVAGEMNLDLVFQQTLTIDDKMPSWESVLFARPQFDITDAVLQKLNTK